MTLHHHMHRIRPVAAALIVGMVSAALAVCSTGFRDRPQHFMEFKDKNQNSTPDDCENASHRFGLRSWPVSRNGNLVPKGRAPAATEDQLLFCSINDSSYWAVLVVAHEFARSSARPQFVLFDLTHSELDTMRTNVMSSTTIQAACVLRNQKRPIVLAASVDSDTLYAYLRH